MNPKYGQFRTCSCAASLHSILGCNIYTASICIDAPEAPLEAICCPQTTLPSLDSMIQPQTLPGKCVIWGQREICACGKFLTPQICFGLLLSKGYEQKSWWWSSQEIMAPSLSCVEQLYCITVLFMIRCNFF